jgi:hypothetical protein
MKTKDKTAEQIVYEMLTENTGSHFLDSGGHYGRHWEANQKRTLESFKNEPTVNLEFDDDGVLESWTISVFHYLVGNDDSSYDLDVDDICHKFNKINTNADNYDDDRFYGVSKEAGDFLDSLDPDFEIRQTTNTYNGETIQTLVYLLYLMGICQSGFLALKPLIMTM